MQTERNDLAPAQHYVESLYRSFPGRVPIVVGGTLGFGMVYPFVFEDSDGRAIGCVGCAWNKNAEPDLVQIYHVNAFRPRRGDGKKILEGLCDRADRYDVRLTLMPQARWVDDEYPLEDDELRKWYRQFGFNGLGYLTRSANQS